MTHERARPYGAAALARWSLLELAEAAGTTTRQVVRWRAEGALTSEWADRVAVGLGFHPVELWPEWADVCPTPSTSRGVNGSCSCVECSALARVYGRRRRRARGRRRERGSMPEDRHGTPGGYREWRCRCSRCREAQAEAVAEWRRRRGAVA